MIYFTSDTHFGHEKAVNFPDRKGFTVDTWADMMINLINNKVTKSDRLFILGDFALGSHKQFLAIREKIKVKDLWLIFGNHDPSNELCKKVFGDKFRHVHECKIKGTPTWLSHYPHLAWPKSHYGSFHLFGHLHNQRTNYYNSIFPEMRSMDVCPEHYKDIYGEWGIFSEDQIYDILIKRKGHDDVSWYKEQRGELSAPNQE